MNKGRLSEYEKQFVKEQRGMNKSYTEIAKLLNCKKDRVKRYCQENGLGGSLADDLSSDTFKRFINGFNERHGNRFEYVSGFVDSEFPVLIRCKGCGNEIERSAQIARKDKRITCKPCAIRSKEQKEEQMRKQKELKQKLKKIRREKERSEEYVSLCNECGNVFSGKRKGMKYCSDSCQNKHNNRSKEIRRRKKIKENGEIHWDISLEKLIKKDKSICALCGSEVNVNDYKTTREGHFVAGESYPSIDHIKPIAKGGTHTWDNVQLAHRVCNAVKSDKEIMEETGQMILIL